MSAQMSAQMASKAECAGGIEGSEHTCPQLVVRQAAAGATRQMAQHVPSSSMMMGFPSLLKASANETTVRFHGC